MDKGICIDCKEDKFIVSAKGRCGDCQYKKNHNNKSRFEVNKEKERSKPVKIYRIINKPPQKRKKTIPKVYRKKATGEYKLFLEIWDEREHICVNCKQNLDRFVDPETGKPIAFLFSHIKTKGSRGDLRLVKTNIELLCTQCHYSHESLGDVAYNKRKDLYK